jgi:8-oxo-dGTP diphosphatase
MARECMKEFRIAAAAIIIHEEKVLLVRYRDRYGESFLVGPGGGVHIDEDLKRALIREVREETGLEVQPEKLLFIGDLLSRRYRMMIKVWLLCKLVGGHLLATQTY